MLNLSYYIVHKFILHQWFTEITDSVMLTLWLVHTVTCRWFCKWTALSTSAHTWHEHASHIPLVIGTHPITSRRACCSLTVGGSKAHNRGWFTSNRNELHVCWRYQNRRFWANIVAQHVWVARVFSAWAPPQDVVDKAGRCFSSAAKQEN